MSNSEKITKETKELRSLLAFEIESKELLERRIDEMSKSI
jgi:hypothetical protein